MAGKSNVCGDCLQSTERGKGEEDWVGGGGGRGWCVWGVRDPRPYSKKGCIHLMRDANGEA